MTSAISVPTQRQVVIHAGSARLQGTLALPPQPAGLVVFVHGSGSSRMSPRNAAVAQRLRSTGLGTLLFDLLTEPEAADRSNVFDITLLAERLRETTTWLQRQPEAADLAIGYFGASTGAAAALMAAAASPGDVEAIVSRGGRPDLAGEALARVRAPTLLLVGSRDPVVLGLNQYALGRLACPARLVVIPGATHLFEEPGTLEEAGRLAAAWFLHHLASQPATGRPA
jgi:putative phosphoribosyl transferase